MSTNNRITLSGDDLNRLHACADNPPQFPDLARTGAANPHLRVFIVNFDGTANDKSAVVLDGESRATLVAASHVHYKSESERSINDSIVSKYYSGVGTNSFGAENDLGHKPSEGGYLSSVASSISKGVINLIQKVTGLGCVDRAERAHQDLVEQVKMWRQTDPDVTVHVHCVGFSRGAATGLHFMNLVDSRGALNKSVDATQSLCDRCGPGSVRQSAILIDPVSTGQGGILDLTAAPTCDALTILKAEHEPRILFPFREVSDAGANEISFVKNAHLLGAIESSRGIHYQRIQTVAMPGVHSDIGGGYGSGAIDGKRDDGGIREVSAYVIASIQNSLGLPIKPVKPSFERIQTAYAHNSNDLLNLFGGNSIQNTPSHEHQPGARLTDPVQRSRWTGEYIVQSSITGLDAPINSSRMGCLNLNAVVDELEPWIGACANAKIELNDSAAPGLIIDSGARDAFRFDGERLLYRGKAVPGCPPASQLLAALIADKAQGRMAAPITVSIDARRMGSNIDAGQTIGSSPMLPIIQAPDPWPEAVRDALRRINSSEKISAQDAGQLLCDAVAGVAKELYSGCFNMQSIQIKRSYNPKDSSINPFDGGIEITGVPSQGLTPESKPWNMDDAALQARLRVLGRGLTAVGKGLLSHGFELPKVFLQTFESGKSNSDMGIVMTRMNDYSSLKAQPQVNIHPAIFGDASQITTQTKVKIDLSKMILPSLTGAPCGDSINTPSISARRLSV